MEHIGEIIPGAIDYPSYEQDKGSETCLVCGTKIEFAENQVRKRCPKCGTIVQAREDPNRAEMRPKCRACKDTGWVNYKVQYDGRLYDYVARCDCRAGAKHNENIPMISQVGLEG